VFVGFHRTRRGNETVDFWHLRDGSTIRCVDAVLERSEGDSAATLVSRLQWLDKTGVPWVEERRKVTVLAQPTGRRVFDYEITLAALGAPVVLDGDPHHAGFQLRADDELSARAAETRWVRPEGARDLGNDVWADCTWAAADFTLRGRRVVVQYIPHEENPGPWVASTRGYGRVGALARSELVPGRPLVLRCRLVVIDAGSRPQDATPQALQGSFEDYAAGRAARSGRLRSTAATGRS
jgi:hypothetical protein